MHQPPCETMNPALLTLSYLLFALTVAFSSEDLVEQVMDTNHNPIFPGGRFYIKPATSGAAGGGGVRPGKTGNSTCPDTVLQDYSDVVDGLPVKFTIPGISPGIIFTGTPLYISFEEKPECAESSKWVDIISDDFHGHWVGIGGAHHPGKNLIVDGRFNIQRYDDSSYKFVFCPEIVNLPHACFDVGRYDDENGRRLVLNTTAGHVPYQVLFVDAGDEKTM